MECETNHKRKRDEEEDSAKTTILFNKDMMLIIFTHLFENIHREIHLLLYKPGVGRRYFDSIVEKTRKEWAGVNAVCKAWKSFVASTMKRCYIETCNYLLNSYLIPECGSALCKPRGFILGRIKDIHKCSICPRIACDWCVRKDEPSWTNVLVRCNVCWQQMCVDCAREDDKHQKCSAVRQDLLNL